MDGFTNAMALAAVVMAVGAVAVYGRGRRSDAVHRTAPSVEARRRTGDPEVAAATPVHVP